MFDKVVFEFTLRFLSLLFELDFVLFGGLFFFLNALKRRLVSEVFFSNLTSIKSFVKPNFSFFSPSKMLFIVFLSFSSLFLRTSSPLFGVAISVVTSSAASISSVGLPSLMAREYLSIFARIFSRSLLNASSIIFCP